MYETKRTYALKTLDKKQTKVDEINKVRRHTCLRRLPASSRRLAGRLPASSRSRAHAQRRHPLVPGGEWRL